ncbi:LysR family transcriptional regulator, partial [Candidatus Pseudothioglobus singularis]|nr:LysR family transcriptional regulator [Candidatus Pseudothioglobus singularis]
MKQYSLIELETYQAVVEAGSFNLAADRLSTSAATVSRRISTLESALGVRLLNRTTRNINLTEAGEQYLDDVKNILESVEISEERIGEGKAEAKGELRIAAPLSFGIKHLSPVLPSF